MDVVALTSIFLASGAVAMGTATLAHRLAAGRDEAAAPTAKTWALRALWAALPLIGGLLFLPLVPPSNDLGMFPAGAALGGVVAVIIACTSLGKSRERWRWRRRAEALRDPARQERVRRQLSRRLSDSLAVFDPSRYARAMATTVHAFTRAYLWEDVLHLLSKARYDRIDVGTRRLLHIYGALANVHLGRLDLARLWLDRAVGPATEETEVWQSVLESAVSLSEGKIDRVRELKRRLDGGRYELERAVIEAHSLAAEGRSHEARKQIVRVQQELDESLESLFLVPGPATPIAATLRSGSESPFR